MKGEIKMKTKIILCCSKNVKGRQVYSYDIHIHTDGTIETYCHICKKVKLAMSPAEQGGEK